jgi:hypothetical protein
VRAADFETAFLDETWALEIAPPDEPAPQMIFLPASYRQSPN